MRRYFTVAATCLPVIMGVPASAQTMPPDIAEKLATIGRVIAPPPTNALYEPLHQQEPFQGIRIARDVKYGDDPLTVLDVFSAEATGGAPRPVFVHVHGGGFIRGDKKTANSAFLDNIPVWAVRNGMVGININYRLAPKAIWPSGPEDMAGTVKWIKANIANYGGDPNRIYLMGWSAGANHVAAYVAFPQFHAVPGSGLAGAILLSGSPFDTTVFDMKPYEPYFGADATKYAAASPQPGLLKTDVPLMVAYAGLDPVAIEKESINLIDAMCKAQRCPTKAFLKTHSHMSSGNAIGTKDTELTDQMLTFMKIGKPTN
ncbi:MAG TPA: alpha/beta hydrolase [Xanthobacteraceae bacterium]|nr:alpha/beta hydrolase [Xanthobacteraceae bacterium]